MDINPKARFIKSEDAKWWADVTANPGFARVIESALSQMLVDEPNSPVPATNWARLDGARAFARIISNIAEPPERVRRGSPRENLELP